jgi:hypothetical protein
MDAFASARIFCFLTRVFHARAIAHPARQRHQSKIVSRASDNPPNPKSKIQTPCSTSTSSPFFPECSTVS